MRHGNHGKKLGRDSAHRKALYSNLAGAVIEHGRIKTTITKAKAVKPIAEQMITLGRRGDIHARRQAVAFLRSKSIVHKLFTELGPRFADRPGGYLRITRIGARQGDAAEMAYLELVDTPLVFKTKVSDLPADEQVQVVLLDEDEPETAVSDEVPAAEEPEAAASEDVPAAEGTTADASDSTEENTDSAKAES